MNTWIKNGVLCFPGESFKADLMIENDTIPRFPYYQTMSTL